MKPIDAFNRSTSPSACLSGRFDTRAHGECLGGLNRRRCLAGLFSLGLAPAFAKRPMRELPIPLAREAATGWDPAGYLVSEKYDGVRALWDGRQLRFRSGLSVAAPTWFLARLPRDPLDGELWLARGQFEALSGAVRRNRADDGEWRAIQYQVFDLPLAEGGFAQRQRRLVALIAQAGWPALQAVRQENLASAAALQQRLDEVVRAGGEGLILRREDAPYAAGRSDAMLKLKPQSDDEATVIGIEAGRGRLQGRMGALQVRTDGGVHFKIGTGFDDSQRTHPPRIGERISFSYRGLTEAGVPRFASFLRLRPAGI